MPLFSSVNDAIDWLLENVRKQGIEGLFRRYYGVYPCKVTSNSDPDGMGKIRCILPVLGSTKENPIWIKPMVSGGSQGAFVSVPQVDDLVWVMFENGDMNRPVYTGSIPKNKAYYSKLAQVEKRGIQTPHGHVLVFDDQADTIVVEHATGAKIQIGADGTIDVIPAAGKLVNLGQGVLSALVRSDTFKLLYNSHTHTVASVGAPTSPPLVPMASAQETTTTKAT